LGDRPDLLEKMTPTSPVLSSRPVLCEADDNVLHVLLRDDVELIDTGIERITAKGIETPDGKEIPFDVIIFATGFKAQDFLWPMEIRGRNGQTIEELWQEDGPRAYLGTMYPGFPNLFSIYGPNTSPYSGGTPSDYTEYTVRFGLECIRGLIEANKQSVEVNQDAYWRFAEEHDRWEAIKIYMDPRTRTYFHNEHGRSPANAAIDVRKYWGWLRSPTGPRPGQPPIWQGGPIEESTELRPYFGEDLKVS
jgi:4-hydroxyacetophenone monooxygenase